MKKSLFIIFIGLLASIVGALPLYAQESCYAQYLREHNMRVLTAEDTDDNYDELKKAVLAWQLYGSEVSLPVAPKEEPATPKQQDTAYVIVYLTLVDSTWYMWLSVDPLADKYPSNTPYMYCNGNPIVRIDPDGRADYYDVDGNHLCNDGIDDRKVYQQSDKGDIVFGGYAIPFSYVGDVDKISLSYEGEMKSDSQSKGTLTIIQHVGEKQFSRGFSAISGYGSTKDGNARYTLQNGNYICYGYIPNVCQKGYVKDGIGFKIQLRTDGWNTQRYGLQIHPDQYPPGTLGCIGLTGSASELSLFQKMASPFMSGGNTSPLSVLITGNPQCYRAVDKTKGWLVPLFCK